ncbi:MAG: mechanosensitive ion channel [Lewinellaceae bacterium]|nr:mechanosensitive ion channel [Lewinellaceae bacterium]
MNKFSWAGSGASRLEPTKICGKCGGAWMAQWRLALPLVYPPGLSGRFGMAATCHVVLEGCRGCHWYHLPCQDIGQAGARQHLRNCRSFANGFPDALCPACYDLHHWIADHTGALRHFHHADADGTGVGGPFAVALALQDTLSNLFAGIQIIASRKLQPGQYITLEGLQEGYITDITWRNTTIQTLRNTLVIVPNKTIASSIVTNTWLPDSEISVLVECSVHYKSNLEEVERLRLRWPNNCRSTTKALCLRMSPPSGFMLWSLQYRFQGLRAINYEWQYALRSEMIKRLCNFFRRKELLSLSDSYRKWMPICCRRSVLATNSRAEYK